MKEWSRLGRRRRKRNYLGVLGHVNMDIIYRVPRLPSPGLSINAESVDIQFGGTAGNIAVHSARLGVPTALGCYLGRDFDASFSRLLQESAVDTYDAILSSADRTPRCHIFDDGREQTYVIEQGAMDSRSELPLWEHAVGSSSIVHVGTGDPERYRRAVSGRDYNFDPGQEISYRYTPGIFRELLSGCSIFFGNEKEIRTAVKLMSIKDEKELADYCQAVVKTSGRRGTRIITADAVHMVRAATVELLVDTIGAGDAFRAGFYAALYRGKELISAVQMGNTMAAMSLSGKGGISQAVGWKDLLIRWEKEYC
jgi:sugar/nucleoside kinase (ribokinase family)